MSEKEKFSVEVGGKEYNLIKKGRDQADQVVGITQWLSKFGMPVYDKLSSGDAGDLNNVQVILTILDNLSSDALVSLFSTVIGCTPRVAEREFDFGILVEAIEIVWNNQPAIKRIINRFFSSTDSESSTEEQPIE